MIKVEHMRELFESKTKDIHKVILPLARMFAGDRELTVEPDKLNNLWLYFGRAEHYPLLCSHADTVHRIDEHAAMDKLVCYDPTHQVFWSPDGVGGDDRCGIIISLSVIKQTTMPVAMVVFNDEERGCQGSRGSNHDPDRLGYCITMDRRGHNDIIFNAAGTKLASKKFKADIEPIATKYGFSPAQGSLTDAIQVTERWKISSLNISSGYYNPHRETEYVKVSDMQHTTNAVSEIIQALGTERYAYVPQRPFPDEHVPVRRGCVTYYPGTPYAAYQQPIGFQSTHHTTEKGWSRGGLWYKEEQERREREEIEKEIAAYRAKAAARGNKGKGKKRKQAALTTEDDSSRFVAQVYDKSTGDWKNVRVDGLADETVTDISEKPTPERDVDLDIQALCKEFPGTTFCVDCLTEVNHADSECVYCGSRRIHHAYQGIREG